MANKDRKTQLQKGENVTITRDMVVADDINPRIIPEENLKRLKKSIKKNGLVGTLIWNRKTGHIVGGHQRLAALDSLMRTENYSLDVTAVEMELKDEVALNVQLNNQDSQGEFDFVALQDLAVDFGLDVMEDFGFSKEIAELNFSELIDEIAPEMEKEERIASEESIQAMRDRKKKVRESVKKEKEEKGDKYGEAKGFINVVFDSQSAMRQWFIDRGYEEPPTTIHVYDFEKLARKEK